MKTKEELNELKEEVEALNKKLAELTEEELSQVRGGFYYVDPLGSCEAFEPSFPMRVEVIVGSCTCCKYALQINGGCACIR